MILSIEGIDGVGKTTVCNLISEMTSWPVLDINKQMPEPKYKHWFDADDWKGAAFTIASLSLAGADVILDRNTLSYWAYQQRHMPGIEYLEEIMKCYKPHIVLLQEDYETCLERDNHWSIDDLVYQNHRMLAAAECLKRADVPVMVYNITCLTPERIAKGVLRWINS